ncbi:hypothetical protein NM688_g104 [Phlebia brevispora]|uniref:Uncharacterized protein n=1 Tax=Phlebia brevispora TaxID=194682 RepID=A0ACC1TF61_9APHY|nr:hypothetical protein NM688_g104 [Phlebia brevispora]
MSKPDVIPKTTLAGIAVDPRTLERVIPESRRPDGSVRKELKIRPGFTPQEDVQRFRGTRQAQMEANVLPKGHIVGWVPPSSSTQAKPAAGMSKSAKKNAKRKEKRKEKVAEKIKDSWEDDDDEEASSADAKSTATPPTKEQNATAKKNEGGTDSLAEKLEKLDVR